MEFIQAEAPHGMSYVNAWYALYQKAEMAEFFQQRQECLPSFMERVETAQKVAQIFQKSFKEKKVSYYMECEGGRDMKVHFHRFPLLDVTEYDKRYGIGSAQKILNEYNRITSLDRFDKGDRCSFYILPLCTCEECSDELAELREEYFSPQRLFPLLPAYLRRAEDDDVSSTMVQSQSRPSDLFFSLPGVQSQVDSQAVKMLHQEGVYPLRAGKK